jgi:hypothetical protein
MDNPEMVFEFGAVITDGNGDTVTTTFDVTVDSDNSLETDGSELIIGGDGYDTIKILSGHDIDFGSLKNIEEIDLSAVGTHTLENLTAQDVMEMTDSNNTIKITGTSEDNVKLGGAWDNPIDNGTGFKEYTSSEDSTVKLIIQDDITVTTI